MARRRAVGKEPKGDVGEYSTIGVKNIICNNSREIKEFTKTLSDRMMVSPGVSDQKQPWLTESRLDLIGECSRGEFTSNGAAANISGKLEDSPLGVRAAGHHEHVLGVLNSCDGPGGEHHLLPGLLQVDDVDAVGLLLEDVLLHCGLAVVRPDVRGGGEHLGDVILLQVVRNFSSEGRVCNFGPNRFSRFQFKR